MAVTVDANLTDEQREVLGKVEKLLRLAGGTKSEAEAASAAAKAQELLAAYNLSASSVDTGESDGVRAEELQRGGFYEFEREVWRAVAELNYCLYWSQMGWQARPAKDAARAKVQGYVDPWRRTHRLVRQHKVLGRRVNVVATINMATYLLGAVERACREFLALGVAPGNEGAVVGLTASLRSRRAVSFREGAAESIISALWRRRSEAIAEERRLAREAEERAAAAANGPASSSTALTLSTLRQSEHDANVDHVMGEPGYSARMRAEQATARVARAKAKAEADAEAAAWALAHPGEAAAREAERAKEQRKRDRAAARRGGGYGRAPAAPKARDYGAYHAGERAGLAIGIDPQASARGTKGLLK